MSTIDPRGTTELTIRITEGGDSGLDVKYEGRIVETDTKIAMRPSHIVGQLVCAAVFVIIDSYDTIKAELSAKLKKSEK